MESMATKEMMIGNKSAEPAGEKTCPAGQAKSLSQWKCFLLAAFGLIVCFSVPFYHLARFAWGNELYSYILLVPFISWYLARGKRPEQQIESRPMRSAGVTFLTMGAAVAGWYCFLRITGEALETEDGLALLMLSFFFLFLGSALFTLGKNTIQ